MSRQGVKGDSDLLLDQEQGMQTEFPVCVCVCVFMNPLTFLGISVRKLSVLPAVARFYASDTHCCTSFSRF